MAFPMRRPEEKTVDRAAQLMIRRAEELGIEVVYHRYERMQPQCGFGLLGLCCWLCMMGPCRIDPFGVGPSKGVCGANADTMVARRVLLHIANGEAAHGEHAFHVLETFRTAAECSSKKLSFPYRIADEKKLRVIARRLGIPDVDTRPVLDLAIEVAKIIEEDFTRTTEEPLNLLKAYSIEKRKRTFERLGIAPRSIWREGFEALHRIHVGVDADYRSLLIHGLRTALADCYAMVAATELQDVLFGTPRPVESYANLGVLKQDEVNIVIHGHNPLLSMKVVELARSEEMLNLAKSVGAKGINVCGICCTANEVLMRMGVPLAGNLLHQELALATGAVEAMVVDYQCVMPSLADIAGCFHTKLITTMPAARIPGAVHVEWRAERADEVAREILRLAIEGFRARNGEKVFIPDVKSRVIAGFSVEAILEALGGTLAPLIEAVKRGDIRGIVGIVGCNNPKVPQDRGHVELARELISNDVLVVGTGCWAIAAAKAGLMTLEAQSMAGPRLRRVLEALKIPPCLHMGSCVDNSRILTALNAIADALGVDIPDLPVFGSAPEAMSSKAVSIGTWFVAHGVNVHLGIVPPVLGSEAVTKLLTEDVAGLVGARFVVEPDVKKAAEIILEHIDRRRRALGLPT
ncbi:MAG: anaerobic carbon-monoxide dehydrogenase catalytic subunit [Desulfurococcaceae archaeon]